MHFTHAVTRLPTGPAPGSPLGDVNAELCRQQFHRFVDTLLGLGLFVATLPAQTGARRAHRVADSAVVVPELAILTPPGRSSRHDEIDSMAPLLARFRPTLQLSPGARLDAGDVLRVGKTFLVGVSDQTDEQGIREFARIVEGYGYRVRAVDTASRRPLRNTVSYLGRNRLMLAESEAGHPAFRDFSLLVVDQDEADAGGTLWLNETLLTPAGCPGTLARLQEEGLPVVAVDTRAFPANHAGPASLALCF
ncbi:amidinotransferase [Neisseriaceae bacterium JH1-16]|nr:amidinotransferase [Neisseriaceae bacterium JH1-16]